jgi:hypothetical protein
VRLLATDGTHFLATKREPLDITSARFLYWTIDNPNAFDLSTLINPADYPNDSGSFAFGSPGGALWTYNGRVYVGLRATRGAGGGDVGYLLTAPVPEPATCLILVVGVGAAIGRRRRRR